MKKILLAVLMASMVVLTACSGEKSSTKETPQKENEENQHKVVYIIQGGKLGDQAENDAVWSGVQKYAEETGIECAAFELAELQDFESTARSYCDKGFDLIICTNTVEEFVEGIAQDYPEACFVVKEGKLETDLDNILNVRTKIQEAGFVSGAFAALFNKELTGKAETAFIGGVRNPDLDRARYGFAAGAKYVGGNSTDLFVGSFTDAAKAKELATQLYSDDVRIMQAWSGGANTGIFEAAKNMGENYYAMGGATGQFHMSEKIVASQVKNSDVTYYNVCKNVYNNEWEAGTLLLGLEENAVGIKYAPDGRDAVIPQEIKDRVEELKEKVISGEIIPPSTEEEYNEFLQEIQ